MSDRPTSMVPGAKKTKILMKGALDIAGLLVVGALSAYQSWDPMLTGGIVMTILGLMRYQPIRDKGGPIAALLGGAAALAGKNLPIG